MAGQCVQSLSELSRMFAHQFAVICGVRDNNESGGEVVALQARRHYRDVSSEHERHRAHSPVWPPLMSGGSGMSAGCIPYVLASSVHVPTSCAPVLHHNTNLTINHNRHLPK